MVGYKFKDSVEVYSMLSSSRWERPNAKRAHLRVPSTCHPQPFALSPSADTAGLAGGFRG